MYYKNKIIGGIYDNRLLVKPVKSAVKYMPEANFVLPYAGAKEMLEVDRIDDGDYLRGLFEAVFNELPEKDCKRKE